MQYLHKTEKLLLEKGALYTAKEIAGQPGLWKKTAAKFYNESSVINHFINKSYRQIDSIIITGAGTSAFIGLSLQGSFFCNTNILTTAIATTDIVSHPTYYFSQSHIPLIISFARSGNSPESCAVVELADKLCKKAFHLIITCDENGALANYTSKNDRYVFVLPKEANDKSLAMTGSYTSMLLTGLLTANIQHKDFCLSQIELLVQTAEKIFQDDAKFINHIAEKDFQRAVFLGSGALFGTATEAALKLQELTDGNIICKADTYLGFRHGPKSIIDKHTLVIYLFSNNAHALQYEKDLLLSMQKGNRALYEISISEEYMPTDALHYQIAYAQYQNKIAENFLPLCHILPCQLLGFYKSLQLGFMPDSPSESGAISRVVEGVNIYPLQHQQNMI